MCVASGVCYQGGRYRSTRLICCCSRCSCISCRRLIPNRHCSGQNRIWNRTTRDARCGKRRIQRGRSEHRPIDKIRAGSLNEAGECQQKYRENLFHFFTLKSNFLNCRNSCRRDHLPDFRMQILIVRHNYILNRSSNVLQIGIGNRGHNRTIYIEPVIRLPCA